MVLLLELRYDKRDTTPTASKKRKPILSETAEWVDPDQLRGSYVCSFCNGAKGSNAAGYDSETDNLVPLFNPRSDVWETHFFWDGPVLKGRTPIGRATIDVLSINDAICVDQREFLMEAGLFPPDLHG